MKIFFLILLFTCGIIQGQGKPEEIPEGIEVIRDIEYTKVGDQTLTLDVYRPFDWADLNFTPVVIWIPSESEPEQPNPALYLAQGDMTVVKINYRTSKQAEWPAAIDDCYAAVRWIRKNAKLYGFGEKIGVWGRYQGGQLASLLGTRKFDGEETVSSEVQAVCNFYGITQSIENGPQVTDASPLHHAGTDDATIITVHAEQDTKVPFQHSKQLHEKLKQAGVDSNLIPLHDAELFKSDKMQELVKEFFKAHLF